MKKIKFVFSLAGVLFFSLINVYAQQWPANEVLPVPINTNEIKRQASAQSGHEGIEIYYESRQSPKEISSFYSNRLITFGWKKFYVSGDNIIFDKKDELISLSFLPDGMYNDGKAHFILSRSKQTQDMVSQPRISSDTWPLPESNKKPAQEITPPYPGSALASLSEDSNFMMATYFSKDGIEEVFDFYKEKMADYGWNLDSQTPIQKISGEKPGKADSLTGTWTAELNFSNDKKESCGVFLSDMLLGDKPPFSSDITTITIRYEKNPQF